VKILDRSAFQERRARIELMVELYRRARQRRVMRMARRMWRQTATEEQLARLEAPPERIH